MKTPTPDTPARHPGSALRIALISYEFPPLTLGGIATYARHSVRMLAERGHDVTVFAGSTSPDPLEESWHGARVVRLPCLDRKTFSRVAVPALAAAHRLSPFDVAEVPDLYAEGEGLRAAAPDLPFILRAHTPLYIASEIDFLASPPAHRRLAALRRVLGGVIHRQPLAETLRAARERIDFKRGYHPGLDPELRVAREADLVVPCSRLLGRRLVRDWGLPEARVRPLPNPHSPSARLLALPPPTEARVIGFHGGVRRFKGVHVLAEAMPLVLARHPEVRFTLAGASNTSPVPALSLRAWLSDRMVEWRDTAEWLRPRFEALGSRVTLRGFVSPEKIEDHLAESDLCVFPSLFDNFPGACLEAMAAARPIVATRSGGMEEMLGGPDEAGLLVPPGDPRALAAALCRLIEEPDLRATLARRARARVSSLCSFAEIGPRHEEILREAISLRRSAPAHA